MRRREFVATLAALAACRTAQQAEGTPAVSQAPECPPDAEALLGVDFTEDELRSCTPEMRARLIPEWYRGEGAGTA